MPATKIILRCSVCREFNYYTEKNRQNNPDKLTLRKFCPRCRKHTPHDETPLRK
ncbi:MAG: 50S ribosomal protein L33 [Armatimonadetes bacterium]|nr:50S ribosomal protein L33 [Armatimonadota bacterium]